MLIYATSEDGQRWKAGTTHAANVIVGIPVGTRITGIHVDGNDEACDFITEDQDGVLISLPVIRRLFGGPRKVA